MSIVLGVFAIALMVVVLVIAAASLVVVAIIPIGRFVEKRRLAKLHSDSSGEINP